MYRVMLFFITISCCFAQEKESFFPNHIRLNEHETISRHQLKSYVWIWQSSNDNRHVLKGCKIDHSLIDNQYRDCFFCISIDETTKKFTLCAFFQCPFLSIKTVPNKNLLELDFIGAFDQERYTQLINEKKIQIIAQGRFINYPCIDNYSEFFSNVIISNIKRYMLAKNKLQKQQP